MEINLSLIQLVTILSVANGLVFALLLIDKKENKSANKYLSLTIICLSVTFTPYMLDPEIWHQYRWLAWLPFSLSYWIGPSFYFYVKTLIEENRSFKIRSLWHFSPIILNYLHSIYHAINSNSNPFPWFHYIAEMLESAAILSIIAYMILSISLINGYQTSLRERYSFIDFVDLQWIKRIALVISFTFTAIMVFLIVSSGFSGMETFDQWNNLRSVFLMLYAVLLYWISIGGYRQAQTLKIFPLPESGNQMPDNHQLQLICESMEQDGLYRNPQLTLNELSKILNIPERSISNVLNQELGKNYFQFINEYRVKEVKERLLDSQYDHLKIISLAHDSGFNSKASFNRIFKSVEGVTPKEYREKNRL